MAFKEYVTELQRNLKSGHATEPSFYPVLKSLLESLDSSVAALQNPKKTEHGSPDFRVVRKKTIDFPVGWIEAKLPGEDLDKIERSEQLKQQIEKDCGMSITVARTEIGGYCSACKNSKS